MKKIVKVRLLPTPQQVSALAVTLHVCNSAASWLSGLSAQPTIRVISKVADSYSTLRANLRAGNYGSPGSERRRKVESMPIRFRMDAAQPFDARCLSWRLPEIGRDGTVSIWTVDGRMKNLRLVGNPEQLRLLRRRAVGETDLIHRAGQWLLHAVIDAPEALPCEPDGFLGIDKTSSARRLLKKRRRKEARFAADVNHKISKGIVAEAQRTGRGIAVEELTGIRARVRLRKPQRATMHTWAFVHVCWYVDRNNRRSQASFLCGRCDFVAHADHNAALNIAARGVVCWGEVMRPDAAPILTASQDGSSKPIGGPGTRGQVTSLSRQ